MGLAGLVGLAGAGLAGGLAGLAGLSIARPRAEASKSSAGPGTGIGS